MSRDIKWESFHYDFQDSSKDEEQLYDTAEEALSAESPTLMNTVFGLYNMDDSMNPFKNFKFWLAYTNFKITEEVFNILDLEIDGIESLTVISPYRFIIAVGELFDSTDVKARVEYELCGKQIPLFKIMSIENKELCKLVKEEYLKIRKRNKYWVLYIIPNGEVVKEVVETPEEFVEKLEVYKEAQSLSNGVLISSNDENNNR